MAVKSPTFISPDVETGWTTLNPASQEKTFSVNANDQILVYLMDEEAAGTLAFAISGGGLTWSERKVSKPSGECYVVGWTAKATSTTSITVKVTASGKGQFGNIGRWGFNALTFRGSEGIGVSAIATGSGAPLLSVTTEQENSALVVAIADFAAVNGEKRKWREGAGAFTEETFSFSSGNYTVYGGFHANAGAAGKKEVGLTEPAGQTYTILVIEVKGTKEGGEIKVVEINDSLHLSQGRTRNVVRAQKDSLGLSEAAKRSTAKTISSSVVLSSKPGQLGKRSQKDAVALAASQGQRVSETVSDHLVLAENPAKHVAHSRADLIVLSQSTARKALVRLADLLGLSESLARAVRKSLADVLPLSESSELRSSVTRADSLALSEAPARTVGRRVADVLGLAESLARRAGRFVADSISLSDSSSATPTEAHEVRDVEVADSLLLHDHVDRVVTYSQADRVVLSEAVGRGVDRLIADSLRLSKATTQRVDRSVNDALRLADSWARRAGLLVADALRLSDLLGLESERRRRALTLRVAIRPKLAADIRVRSQATTAFSVRPRLRTALEIRAKDQAAVKVRAKTRTNLKIRE